MKQDIRELIIEELKKDLIGPRISEDETFWEWKGSGDDENSTEGDRPTSRYISGVLYPQSTPLNADDHLKNTAEGEITDDDDGEEETTSSAIAVGTQPSSLGITCAVPKQTEEINVEINFAKYDRVEREPRRKSKKKDEDSETDEEQQMEVGWKRRAIAESFTIKLKNDRRDLKDNARIVWKIKERSDKYFVTIFLLNTNQKLPGDRYVEADQCIFQPEIKLSNNSRFLSMSDESSVDEDPEPEDMQFDLLFRDKKYFAVGRNCGVEWEIGDEQSPDSVAWVGTTFVPQHMIEQIVPLEITSESENPNPLSNSLLLKTLADVKEFSNYNELLSPIVSEYDEWIKNLEQKLPSIPKKFIPVAENQIKNCNDAKKRISDGIKIISTNDMAGKAFRFANEVMNDQMIYSQWAKDNIKKGGKVETDVPPASQYNPPQWHIFQLAYILLNIKSIVEPTTEDGKEERETVDLLWFPTGGGKTEAYLGIVAFVLAMRRLREEEPNKYGVNVIMRYTYRLLTQQQFQRAAALMCSCELKRQRDPKTWGWEPFLVGLFVGDTTTPNTLATAKLRLNDYIKFNRRPKEQNPVQIINCPRCGMNLGPRNYHISNLPKRMRIRCANKKCDFGDDQNPESFLPVVMTDDDIISALPSLLIGTVDKFARLSWVPEFAAIFGRVRRKCKQHGFLPANTSSGDLCKRHENNDGKPMYRDIEPIPPPELIIQDELHLISGTLGTLTGLYETVIDDLCLHNGIKPKIIASTATIKNSDNQIKWLFARKTTKIFPPQAFKFGDTYFSKINPEKSGKIHLGICATSVGGFTVDARVAAAVLRKVRHIAENKQEFDNITDEQIDPYYTLVSYYNTRRNHGAATRYYEDSVPPFMGTIRKKFERGSKESYPKLNTTELTARLDSGEIPRVFQRLDHPLYKESCKCDEKIRSTSIKAKESICRKRKKPLEGVLDALLCTNMLSVGVDVQRLSLMVINGQPKLVSEYIQASGRIGRSTPGLVISNYKYTNARDLSYFENFDFFHSKYHRNVEPGTLTPFAARARDTGLFGLLVAFVRMYANQQNRCITLAEDPSKFKTGLDLDKLLDKIIDSFEARVKFVDSGERTDAINDFKKKIKLWFTLASKNAKLKYKRNYWKGAAKPKDDVHYLLKKIGDLDPVGFQGQLIPESLRQAEGSIRLYYQPREMFTKNE